MHILTQASKATPDPSDQRHDTPALDLDLNAVIAALPSAVDQVMRKTVPGEYTPELADAIAANAIAELTRTRAEHLAHTEVSA